MSLIFILAVLPVILIASSVIFPADILGFDSSITVVWAEKLASSIAGFDIFLPVHLLVSCMLAIVFLEISYAFWHLFKWLLKMVKP